MFRPAGAYSPRADLVGSSTSQEHPDDAESGCGRKEPVPAMTFFLT